MSHVKRAGALALAPMMLLLAGCGGGILGSPEPAPAPRTGGYTGEIRGEVERVDASTGELWVTRDDGRWVQVRTEPGTRVFYRGDEYQVANLEPGDYVRVRVWQGTGGEDRTDWVEVEESVQERRGEAPPVPPASGGTTLPPPVDGGGEVERLSGTVEWVDDREGRFALRSGREDVVISLPYNLAERERAIFRDLRRGDSVRVEVRRGTDRVELVRFD